MAKSADAFRTISEVADWLGVQSHVLRFWESKFTQVKPVKRAGGRRYYRPTDMLLLGGIRKLLHDDGLTIKGVQKILREEGIAHVADMSPPLDDDTTAKLDSDLVAHVGDDVEMPEAPVDAPANPDQSPFQTQPEDVPAETADEPAEPSVSLPSFLREPTPPPAPANQGEERAEDIPTLTPEFGPFGDTPPEPDARDAPAPQDSPEETVSASEPPSRPEIFYDLPESGETSPEAAPTTSETSAPELHSDHDVPPEPLAEPEAEPAPEQDSLPMFAHAPAAEPDPEPDPEPEVEATPTPRPRIVDAPDDVDVAPGDIAPSVLTKAVMLRNLTPAQRDALRPLVSQLTALRDQMARARHDPR